VLIRQRWDNYFFSDDAVSNRTAIIHTNQTKTDPYLPNDKYIYFETYDPDANRNLCNYIKYKDSLIPVCPGYTNFAYSQIVGRTEVEATDLAGKAAAGYIRLETSVFENSTSGVVPVGPNGIQAFSDINNLEMLDQHVIKTFPDPQDTSKQYNYSATLQGLSADVTCVPSPETFVSGDWGPNLTNTQTHYYIFNYNWSTPSTCGPHGAKDMQTKAAISKQGTVLAYQCPIWNASAIPQAETSGWLYSVWLKGVGPAYNNSVGSLRCDISGYLQEVDVTYYSSIQTFRSRTLSKNQTGIPLMLPLVQSIVNALATGSNQNGNSFADAVIAQNRAHSGSLSNVPAIFAEYMKGMIEWEASNYRMALRTMNPSDYWVSDSVHKQDNSTTNYCNKSFNGTFSLGVLGYNGSAIAAWSLIPLCLITALTLFFLIRGWRVGGALCRFDPTNGVSLIVASSGGGLDGMFRDGGIADPNDPAVNDMEVRYGRINKHVEGRELVGGQLTLGREVSHPQSHGVRVRSEYSYG